jgi:hypothetical protein
VEAKPKGGTNVCGCAFRAARCDDDRPAGDYRPHPDRPLDHLAVVVAVKSCGQPHVHDSFGNSAAPASKSHACPGARRPGPAANLRRCGAARIHRPFLAKIPFGIQGRISTWKIPLKYLPKKSFEWRAYISDGDRQPDRAPDKGFITFIVK